MEEKQTTVLFRKIKMLDVVFITGKPNSRKCTRRLSIVVNAGRSIYFVKQSKHDQQT
jgi:hypothetical protein